MSKVPGLAEDFQLPEKKLIVILKTYGGEQIICQMCDEYAPGDGYYIQNPYTVDDDAIYGKWITGIELDDKGNDPHVYEFPVNQVAAMIPETRIHARMLEQYKSRIGLLPAKFRRRGPVKI